LELPPVAGQNKMIMRIMTTNFTTENKLELFSFSTSVYISTCHFNLGLEAFWNISQFFWFLYPKVFTAIDVILFIQFLL
jgi:uncharacterized membrane protein